MTERRRGLYVHVPFCRAKCGYCSFNSYADQDFYFDAYLEAVLSQLDDLRREHPLMKVATVYFGGGNPYHWGAQRLIAVHEAVKRSWEVVPDAEVSVELNPEGVRAEQLDALRRAGVNRLSIGAQSFNRDVLRAAGRTHAPAATYAAVEAARIAGFHNISLDLIYGLPEQKLAVWKDDLAAAAALEPSHLSIYGLTLELGTPMAQRVDSGSLRVADDDEQADMYEFACGFLESRGLGLYELSNFAAPKRRCAHNLNYWSAGEYLGVGAGAHSHVDGRRWWSIASPPDYIDQVAAGRPVTAGEETLSQRQRVGERIMLAMRLTEGLDLREVGRSDQGSIIAELEKEITSLRDGGLLTTGDRLALTARGRLLANEVMSVFV